MIMKYNYPHKLSGIAPYALSVKSQSDDCDSLSIPTVTSKGIWFEDLSLFTQLGAFS